MKRHASMNRIYRLVWNQLTHMWVVVAENARGRGKSSGRKLVAAALALTGGLFLTPLAMAGPVGGQISAGAGAISQSGLNTTITQTSQNMAINWQSFGIAANETVRFNQPSATSIALNRILGQSPSQIFGSLSANGQVFLLNPNGVLFAPGSQVNVGGLVASTLGLSDADFMAGKFSFSKGSAAGSVVNQGALTAAQGGYIALLAPEVRNEGVISATMGTALLAAGDKVSINLSNGSLLSYNIDQGAISALADNKQLIQADGGQVFMSAKAADALSMAVVNNTGIVEARTVQNVAGTIRLMSDMSVGTVNVAGILDASALNGGNGGFIETSAAHVKIANDAKVTTAATSGLTGSWLIDPVDFTIAATGGDMTGATLSGLLATTPITLQSSSGVKVGSGNVNVNDTVTWAADTNLTLAASNNVNVNASITATGLNASLTISPNTANGVDAASGTGIFNLSTGAAINLPNVSPLSTTALIVGGTSYTVINSLGAAGSVTGTDLQGINGNLSGHYALGSNVDASTTSSWNANAGFAPIGSSYFSAFTGTFDGLGHSISNLYINLPTINYVGLFGNTGTGSVVRNVGLVGGSVSGGSWVGGLVGRNYGTISNSNATNGVNGVGDVGGLVGYNFGGTISNSYATGNVNGSGSVGGLAGINSGVISNSYATGSVSSSLNGAGGLAGDNSNGIISNSYATGSVSGAYEVGGLVGYSNSAVSNSYATGSVRGTYEVGGLVGYNFGGTISNSYATGSVSGSTTVGGLVGYNAYITGTVSNSYWNTDTSGQLTSSGGTGLTTVQMQTASNFVGFNFTTTPGATGNNWVMVNIDGTLNNAAGATGATYPMLASEYSTVINNSHQLQLMAMAPAANYTLAQNINASATGNTSDIWSGATFIPVGNAANPFSGTFDGLGHSVSSLTIDLLPKQTYNLAAAQPVGLFGSTSASSQIQNVGLLSVLVTGYDKVGALIGENNGNVSNSYATGSVTGAFSVGGLIGFNNVGSVSSSYATDSVNGTPVMWYSMSIVNGNYYLGGLIGRNSGAVKNSHATGNVFGSNIIQDGSTALGGLIGGNYSSGNVSNSYATGNVNGARSVGGLIGLNYGNVRNSYATGVITGAVKNLINYGVGGLVGDNRGGVSDSYAIGDVNGPASNWVGGLVGINEGTVSNSYASGNLTGYSDVGGLIGYSYFGLVTNSYWNITTTGQATSSGGGIGLTSSQMMQQSSFSGWNVANTGGSGATWRIYEGHTAPLLTNFLTPLTLSVSSNVAVTYNGSTQSMTGSGAPSISGVFGTGTASGASVGRYDGYYSSQQGYDITEGQLIINPASLSVSGTTLVANKVYDGTTAATLTGGTLSGIFGNDNVTLIQSGNFATKNVGTGVTVTATDSLSGASAGNYTLIEPIALSANISPRALSISAAKVYDGSTLFSTGQLVINNVLSGDSVILGTGTANTANKNVGNWALSSFSGLGLTGLDATNYTLAGVAVGSGTISRAPLTVKYSMASSKVYDGTTSATLSGGVLSGIIVGDSVTLNQSGKFASKNVGTGIWIAATDSLSGAQAGNYTLYQPTGLTANITPLAIAVTATATNKVYDGSINDTITLASTGVLSGEVVTLTNTSATFANKNVGTAKAVAVNGIALSGVDAANYKLLNTSFATKADITPLAITVSATALDKVYDGTVKDLAQLTSSGVLAGDVVKFTKTSVAFSDKNAGNGKTVTVSGIKIGSRDGGNYTINTTATTTANITPKGITVTAKGSNKVYDGTVNDTVMLAVTRVIRGDVISFTNTSATFADKNAGAAKVVTVSGIAASGADAGNYTYNTVATTTGKITQKTITVAATGTNKVYDGTLNDLVSLASLGVLSGDIVSFADTSATFANNKVGAGKVVTVKGITASGADALNYRLGNTTATTTASITP
jgi:filamentous hemagglutinin family protein